MTQSLLPADRKQLHMALIAAFPNLVDLEVVISLSFGIGADAIGPPVSQGAKVLQMIVYAESHDMVDAMINAAISQNGTNLLLQQYAPPILARILAAQAPAAGGYTPPSPYETLIVHGPSPFIARTRLRQFFRDFRTTQGPAVLAVNGAGKVGKSYSLQLLVYIRNELKDFKLAWIDLAEELHADYKPDDLMRSIARQIGLDFALFPKNESYTTPARWHSELCEHLGAEADRLAQPVFIVLDGFHEPNLHPSTRLLVQALIRRVSMRLSPIALVLLNYGPELLAAHKGGPYATENVLPIGSTDLRSYFQDLIRHRGSVPQPPVVDAIVDRVEAAVATALALAPPGAPGGDRPRQCLINEAVMKAVELLP